MSSRIEYERELRQLHSDMIRLGSMVETALTKSLNALKNYDADLCREVIRDDDLIDEQVEVIDRACVLLIARQQPVASDLRDITSNLKLITDLERMADHAEDICGHVLFMIEEKKKLPVLAEILEMFNVCSKMTATALDAYVTRSKEKTHEVLRMDDAVDRLYAESRRRLIELMQEDPADMEGYVSLLMIAKHIERCADHAENVAEWIIYYLEGKFDINDN